MMHSVKILKVWCAFAILPAVSCGPTGEKEARFDFSAAFHAPSGAEDLVGHISSVLPLDFLTVAEGGITDSYQINEFAVDWERDRAYFHKSDSNATLSVIRSFPVSTMVEDRQARMSSVTSITPNNFPGALHTDADGYLYVVQGGHNTRPIIRIDGTSLTEVARFGSPSNSLSNTTTNFVATRWMGAIQNSDLGSNYLLCGSVLADVGILRTSDMTYVWGIGQRVTEPRVGGLVAGAPGEGWILGTGQSTAHTALSLYHVVIAPNAYYDPLTHMTYGVTFTNVATFTPGQILPGATSFWGKAGGLTYDATDNSVIFQVQFAGSLYRTVKWRAGSIEWNVATPFMINYMGSFQSQNRLNNTLWTLMRGRRLIQLSTVTGATVTDEQTNVWEGGAQVYDGVTNTHLVRTDKGWTRISLGLEGALRESMKTSEGFSSGASPNRSSQLSETP
jgi:hypothetical protein